MVNYGMGSYWSFSFVDNYWGLTVLVPGVIYSQKLTGQKKPTIHASGVEEDIEVLKYLYFRVLSFGGGKHLEVDYLDLYLWI